MSDAFSNLNQTSSSGTSDSGGRLDADMKALRDDITKLTASVTDLLKSQASTAQSRVLDAVSDARDRMTDTAADARERVNTATADLEAAIERNPLIAVVTALIAGLFMGVLSRPKR
ncbi:MAG TPA: hypothetical protein VF511_05255 [Chthoniobacterales bacterium]